MKHILQLLPEKLREALRKKPKVHVVRLQGVISANARGNGLSDQSIAPLIEKAFTRGKPDAVALVLNSPGGSPVQSALIGARIRRLAQEKSIPVYAFVEDVAASGGYWLAAAADEIWIDACSVVGSIGVISASFGAHELLAKHGVERRVYTAGQSKSMLDPFRPEKEEDVARLKGILEQLHEVFIAHIKDRRRDKIDRDVFTGEVWVGQRAIELGLADGIGHLKPTLQDVFGDKVRFRVFAKKRSILPFLGARLAEDIGQSIEERALFARYGL